MVDNEKKKVQYLFIHKLLAILILLTGLFFVLDIPFLVARVSLFNQQFIAIFWALVLSLLFVSVPAKKGMPKFKPQWYDYLLIILTVMVGLYPALFYPKILFGMGRVRTIEWVFGIISTLLVLESVRRTAGNAVNLIILFFIAYAKFGYLLSGPIATGRLRLPRLLQQLYVGADFLLGIPLKVVVDTVFGFIVFGVVYLQVGGGDTLMDLSHSLMGKVRGGPAKIAVIASSLFGTISGSAVANATAVGMVTIPLMKRSGYKDYYAGAVEATASTGGQIMPPVMGAAAFVMAEFLGLPYFKVALAAVIPAILYYLGLFIQVDLQAVKTGMKGLSFDKDYSFKKTIKEGWMNIIPIIVLVYTLFVLFWSPGQSAVTSAAVAIIISLINKKTKNIWNKKLIMDLIMSSSKSMFEVVAVSGGAGLIVGLVSYTGLGLSFSHMLTGVAGHNLLLLAIITAIASIILGMGMPTTAAYVLLAILAAPAMVSLGISQLTAHMFVFYFGTLSMITPPVCLAVFAAATIAESNSLEVAYKAMQLAFAGYIVPFVFLYNPGVTLSGSLFENFRDTLITAVAVSFFAVSFEGFIFKKLGIFERILFLAAGLLIIMNIAFLKIGGIILAIGLIIWQYINYKKNILLENSSL